VDIVKKLQEEFKNKASLADYLLALLYEAGGRLSRLKVQKGLFILSRAVSDLSEVLEFKAYRLGPWDPQISDELARLEAQGVVELGEKYVVLKDNRLAETSLEKLPPDHREVVGDVAELLRLATDDEVLLYVYALYGGDEWSDVKSHIYSRRVDLAISLLSKGAVSLSLAARLAGMPLVEFAEELKRRGVKPFKAHAEDIDLAKRL
jgi:predicted HTH domain antitoxin